MAFDPDEFLAASSPKAKAESFDPDEFLASTAPAGSPKPPSPPPDRAAGDDPWQTVARKGSSIASFGFANPIAAAATAAFSHAPGLGPVQSYSDALKGIGESDAASKAANPKADLLGTGLGVVASLPVGGAIGKGIGAVAGGVARVAGVTLPKLGAVASGAASGGVDPVRWSVHRLRGGGSVVVPFVVDG